MTKVFEDYFSELQTDMVSICLENTENQGDNIYIYCSCENNVYSVGYFYKINGDLVERHKLNEKLPGFDISIERQKEVMRILMENLKKIEKVCEKFNNPMPTEMKLVYNIKRNSLDANYQYDLIYSNDSEKTADDIEDEWFDYLVNKS